MGGHFAPAIFRLDDHSPLLGCKGSTIIEPRLGGQKDERYDQKAENIVLPSAPLIVPFNYSVHLIYDVSITHLDGSRARRGCLGVMRDHDDSLVKFLIELTEHIQHDLGIRRIKVAGRLVGQNDRRAIYDRPRQSHPLLLPA